MNKRCDYTTLNLYQLFYIKNSFLKNAEEFGREVYTGGLNQKKKYFDVGKEITNKDMYMRSGKKVSIVKY